jgi:hypothetical protein
MELAPTIGPRWLSCASATVSAWAMRSLPRWRPASPGWPPDSTPAAMITSVIAFVAGGVLATWLLSDDDTGARLRTSPRRAVLALGLTAGLVFVVVWATAASPAHRIGTLVALAAFAVGLLATGARGRTAAG